MKSRTNPFLRPALVIAAAALASSASATTVTWGSATTISSSDEVSTSGTQVFGRSINVAYGTSASIVNGADFGYDNPNWTIGFADAGFSAQFSAGIPSLSGADASDYQTILGKGYEAYPTASGTLTFSSLTLGQQYEIQVWVADYRSFTNVRTETITATGDIASPALTYLNSGGSVHGQSIIGAFTADATSTTFTLNGNETAMYNALQLRAAETNVTWNNNASNMTWSSSDGNWSVGPGWQYATNNAIFGATGAGSVTLGAPVGVHNVTFDAAGYTISSNTLTLNNSTITTNADATISSTLAGSTGLIKSGNGTLTLTGVNSYTGGTSVNQGTLKLDLGARSGNAALGAFAVASGATLNLDNTNTTVGGYYPSGFVLSGEGTVTKTGVGSIDFWNGSNLNNFTGTMDVQQGALRVNNITTGANMSQATLNIASGATFDVRYNASLSVDKLTGSGTLDQSYDGGSGLSVTVGSNNGSSIFDGVISNSSGQAMTLTKAGSGSFTLSGTNSYTGATSVNAGKLLINGNNSAATGTITVAAGTADATPVATLGGSGTGSNGTIGGNVVLAAESASGFKNGGILAPTAAASGTKLSVTGTTTFGAGSIFEWSMSATDPTTDPGNGTANSGTYGQLAGTGAITGSDAVFKIVLGAGNAFTDAFWNTDKTWNNVFTGDGATNTLASIFSSISGSGITFADNKGTVTDQGYFTFSSTSTLSWTAVPEPTSALAGLLLAAGLLRRRR
jgi:fibronectin-binding autotransporter adhesin